MTLSTLWAWPAWGHCAVCFQMPHAAIHVLWLSCCFQPSLPVARTMCFQKDEAVRVGPVTLRSFPYHRATVPWPVNHLLVTLERGHPTVWRCDSCAHRGFVLLLRLHEMQATGSKACTAGRESRVPSFALASFPFAVTKHPVKVTQENKRYLAYNFIMTVGHNDRVLNEMVISLPQ